MNQTSCCSCWSLLLCKPSRLHDTCLLRIKSYNILAALCPFCPANRRNPPEKGCDIFIIHFDHFIIKINESERWLRCLTLLHPSNTLLHPLPESNAMLLEAQSLIKTVRLAQNFPTMTAQWVSLFLSHLHMLLTTHACITAWGTKLNPAQRSACNEFGGST